MKDVYKLRIQVLIERVQRGPEIGNGEQYTGDRMTVTEEMEVPATNFLEMTHILGQFHELGKTVAAAAKR